MLDFPRRHVPTRWPIAIVFRFLCVVGLVSGTQAVAQEKIDFNSQIRPILSNTCFRCHGPDKAERQGGSDGLRLDTEEGAFEDLGGYAAITRGNPDDSELLRRLTTDDDDEVMPPPKAGKRLSKAQIALLRQWIEQGAPFAKHWSYVKPQRPELPAVKDAAWSKNEIDRFLQARMQRENLTPSPEADRAALIRRVSLDLTGLPPTIKEVDLFLSDKRDGAYERLVDRLLQKPTYGEHWARMWLDLARYADSTGYADDPPRTIWAYRDYVIRSLNSNKPFDQFTVEQIAGDLLPEPTEEQLIATAFHRNTLTNNEGGTNDEEYRNVAIVDRVNTTMAVWMGTTINCCQCHDHKYDPITQEEFFRLFAIFNNSQDADRRDESPLVSIYTQEQLQNKKQWQTEIAGLEKTLSTPTQELAAAQSRWEATFAREPVWQALTASQVLSKAGAKIEKLDDGSVRIGAKGKTDVTTLTLPLESSTLSALKLDALADETLPGKGPGHAKGNFVVTAVKAAISPPASSRLSGRFVRIELPGKQKMLSLAEVQVLSGTDNVARRGEASQSSTAFDGPAKLAIDGNTNGDYNVAKSTTHSAVSDNPWWEVDLKSSQPIDRIVLWNRTDNKLHTRLANFRIQVLDELREPVWQQQVKASPNPSSEFSLGGAQGVALAAAYADHSQEGFEALNVLSAGKDANKGWAIGPQSGQDHSLTLIAEKPTAIVAGSQLVVTIEQLSKQENHTLGRLRVSVSSDPTILQFAQTPSPILAILRTAAAQRTEKQQTELAAYHRSIAPELKTDRDRLATLRKQLAALKPTTTVPVMREMVTNRRKTNIQHRGNFLDKGAEVSEGVPSVFHPLSDTESPNRLALARWLIDKDNPLTARVIVNRYWEKIFGVGIVQTSEEFGSQGEAPMHPELLDWLATELIKSEWDMKHLVRLLVTSAAYRQTSQVTPELLERDPTNRLLARGPRFRLSAEMIRDQALFASGLLSAKMHGPPVKPHQPKLGVKAAFGSAIDWTTSTGEDKYRRGLYTTWRRSNPYPSMAAFDAPNREVCTIRRDRTNTPLQALVTLNDPAYVEAAQALARRMVGGGSTAEQRATLGFRLCLARMPSEVELNKLTTLFDKAHQRFSQDAASAKQMATDPLGPVPDGMNATDLAAWTVVGNVLLNLDEMFLKR